MPENKPLRHSLVQSKLELLSHLLVTELCTITGAVGGYPDILTEYMHGSGRTTSGRTVIPRIHV